MLGMLQIVVTPAKAGPQLPLPELNPRVRGDDESRGKRKS